MCYVVRLPFPVILLRSAVAVRHASIDPATRAARGLPEDLIRLCVGIEDPRDLLDDLENALIDAGAITFSVSENRYIRASLVENGEAITKAVAKLVSKEEVQKPEQQQQDWFVSAPGKVILFGEHAVVHGVVSSNSCVSGPGEIEVPRPWA